MLQGSSEPNALATQSSKPSSDLTFLPEAKNDMKDSNTLPCSDACPRPRLQACLATITVMEIEAGERGEEGIFEVKENEGETGTYQLSYRGNSGNWSTEAVVDGGRESEENPEWALVARNDIVSCLGGSGSISKLLVRDTKIVRARSWCLFRTHCHKHPTS